MDPTKHPDQYPQLWFIHGPFVLQGTETGLFCMFTAVIWQQVRISKHDRIILEQ